MKESRGKFSHFTTVRQNLLKTSSEGRGCFGVLVHHSLYDRGRHSTLITISFWQLFVLGFINIKISSTAEKTTLKKTLKNLVELSKFII